MNNPAFAGRCIAFAFLAFTAVFQLGGCLEDAGSGTGGRTLVNLRGRVSDQGGNPIPDVEVRLSHAGTADTTDAAGHFTIAREPDSPPTSQRGLVDTLELSIRGQKVAVFPVENGNDTLPDLRLVHRGVSGKLLHGNLISAHEAGSVRAVLRGTDIPAGHPLTAEFFYNRPANEYSGFMYFPDFGKPGQYEISIEVYDDQGHLQGRSEAIRFNDQAGNITIPPFEIASRALIISVTAKGPGGEGNPVPAMWAESLHVRVTVRPPSGATVVECAWRSITGEFQASEPEWTHFTGLNSGFGLTRFEDSILVRVRDDGGGEAIDTLRILFSDRRLAFSKARWKVVAEEVPALNRERAAVVPAPEGGVMLLGGWGDFPQKYADSTVVREVWYSSDNKNWSRRGDMLPAAILDPRHAVSFHDSIWVLGGNDTAAEVWCTRNGIDWVRAASDAGYPPRRIPLVVAYKDQILMIGGVDAGGKAMDDVWSSGNGRDWRMLTGSIGLSGLWENGAVTATDSQIIVAGDGLAVSADGRSWSVVPTHPASHAAEVQLDSLTRRKALCMPPAFLLSSEGRFLRTVSNLQYALLPGYGVSVFTLWSPEKSLWTAVDDHCKFSSNYPVNSDASFLLASPSRLLSFGGNIRGYRGGRSVYPAVMELDF